MVSKERFMMKKIYPPDIVSGWEYCIVGSDELNKYEFLPGDIRGKPRPSYMTSQSDFYKNVTESMNVLGADCWELAGINKNDIYIFKRPYRCVEDKNGAAG
jgi:hypothetical protein